MKAEDLRIGNIVGYITENSHCTITGICADGIIDSFPLNGNSPNTDRHIDCFIPIKLTEDWLMKFGFKKKIHKWDDGSVSKDLFWLDNYFIGLHEKFNTFSRVLNCRDQQFIDSIDYVHELQNLYYWLTREELNIK